MGAGNIFVEDWQPICDLLVQKLREKIAEQDHNATGALSASVEAEAKELADRWVIEVRANHYGRYVNNGRRIGSMPPVEAIYQWLKERLVDIRLAADETTNAYTHHPYPWRDVNNVYHATLTAPKNILDHFFVTENPHVHLRSFSVDNSAVSLCSSDHSPMIVKATVEEE